MRLIPNRWADFQHYKDRAPPWIRLHRKLLDNKDFHRLPVESRALAPMLWLLASESVDGVIDATYDDLAFRLRCSEAEIQAGLRPLVEKRFFLVDETAIESEDEPSIAAEIARRNGFGSRHIADAVKREVWTRDGGKCCACGATDALEYDHKTPVSKGGTSETANIQLLCRPCNRKKRTKTAEQLATPAQPWLDIRTSETETETEAETSQKQRQRAEAEAEADSLAGAASQAPPPKRAVKTTPAPTSATWDAYALAYQRRYGVEPLRNGKVNGQLAQFLGRVPVDEAPLIAAFYVGHKNRFYVEKGHAVDYLLRDAEKLRTEWATGRQVTATQAQQADRTQTNLDAFGGMLAEAKAREQQGA